MATDYVNYIKSHIKDTLEVNRKMSGADYSIELGVFLDTCLAFPENEQNLALFGALALGDLEKKIEKETGEAPNLHEAKKCGLSIYFLWKEGNEEGLKEIRDYANKLMIGKF